MMSDLKLNVHGPVEDEIYATFPLLIKSIRRGNTVLTMDGPDGRRVRCLARKGLEKFFDLRYEMISPESRHDDRCLTVEQHMQKNYILAGALRAILAGHKVEVLKTLKAARHDAEAHDCAVDRLVVSESRVDEGVIIKRFRPKDRGRAHPIQKKTSHIHLTVDEG